jgi:Flp pilus assembly protein TadG
MKHVRPRSARSSRVGTAAIEFALTLSLLVALLNGCFRVGYPIFAYETLVSSVAGAARYAARIEFDDPNQTFVASVQNMAVYGSPTGGTSPVVPGLMTNNIQVTWTRDAQGLPLTLTVTVQGYTTNAVFQSFTWSGKPSVTVRFAGVYTS